MNKAGPIDLVQELRDERKLCMPKHEGCSMNGVTAYPIDPSPCGETSVLKSLNESSKSTIGFLCSNFNNGAYLRECIDSLISQDSPNWMLYIRDDGSTDGSKEIIQEYSDTRIVSELDFKNRGLIESHRRLMRLAKTEYLAILDPDDALQPGAVTLLLENWRQHPHAAMLYSNFLVCNERLEPLRTGWSRQLNAGESNLTRSSIGHIRSFSRIAYDETTGFDYRYLYAEDFDLLYRLEEVGEVVFIDSLLYRYRTLSNSQSHDPRKKVVGLLNRIASQYDAFCRRRLRPSSAANLPPQRMMILLVKGVLYAIFHRKWKQAHFLGLDTFKLVRMLIFHSQG